MSKRRWFQGVSVMVAVAASAAAGSTAHASKIAQSMATCGGIVIDTSNPGSNNGFGEWEVGNIIPASQTAICPVDNFSATAISSVTVDVFKQTTTAIKVQACVTFAAGFGGNCGAVDPNNSSGLQQLHPALTFWNSNPTDYRWLMITVQRSPAGFNTVFGYRQD
jgi:hypothetical protein